MTETELKNEVLALLGDGAVNIEITPSQWGFILKRSYRWWAARKGVIMKYPLNIVKDVTAYELPQDFKSVIDYIPLGSSQNYFSSMGDVSIAFSNEFSLTYEGYSGLTDFVIGQQRERLSKTVFGADDDYMVEEKTIYGASDSTSVSIFHVSPRPSENGIAYIFYSSADFGSKQLTSLDPIHQEIILNVMLAFAKKTLARIRGKFGQLDVPGSSVTMDADVLMQEANETLTEMEQRIYDVQGSGFFITG